ncbi:MAG: SNF2 helicase-associated domain-containing protein, partial [Acidimicrobiales bacterium]
MVKPGSAWNEVETELDRITFEAAVEADAGGWATAAEHAALEADRPGWVAALRRLVFATDAGLASAAGLTGEERAQVVADLTEERARLAARLEGLSGDHIGDPRRVGEEAPAPAREEGVAAQAVLQGAWADGRVVVWAGGPGALAPDAAGLDELLRAADAGSLAWERHGPVPVPGGEPAEARSAPFAQTLGWLVGIGAGQVHAEVGASLRWLGLVAVWGTELAAQGRLVPVLRSSGPVGATAALLGAANPVPARASAAKPSPGGRGGGVVALKGGPVASRQRVRWAPALVERDRLQDLASRMPGAVVALQSAPQADGVCRSVLTAVVDAIGRAGADRLVAPAAPPHAGSRAELAEALLASLDGRAFTAEHDPAARLAEDLKRWAAPVTVSTRVGLTVRLDPPAADGGWHLAVEATGVDKHPLPVEHALVVASGIKSQQVEGALRRLERLLPVLRRPTTRRGQVVLDGDEAAELMFQSGPTILAAGFDVLLPLVSRRRPSPQLRLFTDAVARRSQVGVQQLANVRWSVMFDDLELDARQIAKLSAEARPLIQVRGRWVHIERADLLAAAAALAERASLTQLSGAAVLGPAG